MAAFNENNDQYGQSRSYDEEEMLIYSKDLGNGAAGGYAGMMNQDLPDTGGTDAGKKKTPVILILAGVAVALALILTVVLLLRGGTGEIPPHDPTQTTESSAGQIPDQTNPTETNQATQPEYHLTLNTGRLSLFVEETSQLTVSGIPEKAELEWSSSDLSVAIVQDGLVTAKGPGSAIITVRWQSVTDIYEASAEVIVKSMGVSLDILQVEEFYVGQSMTINATTAPANQKLTWTSSDEAVAVINSNGVLTAVGSGTTIITAGFGEYSQECTVTVTEPGITLSKTVSSLYLGDNTVVEAKVLPGDMEVKWSSADSTVATVDNKGKITAVGEGSAIITARMSFEGQIYEAECAVTVTMPSVTMSQQTLSLSLGGAAELKATIKPSGCTVSWSSSNSSVASVSGGKVTARGSGTATITARFTYQNRTYKAECVVTVAEPSISVTTNSDTISYSQRDKGTATLTAKVTPDNGSVTWRSSDTSVATVSGNGTTATLTAVSQGTVQVTASYTVGGKTVSDSCTVAVQKAASTLKLENVSYQKRGSLDDFWLEGTLSSNYELDRMVSSAKAEPNGPILSAIGAHATLEPETYYFNEGMFISEGGDTLVSFFKAQYRALYEKWLDVAQVINAEESVTMTINATFYDESGKSVSITITYILDEG